MALISTFVTKFETILCEYSRNNMWIYIRGQSLYTRLNLVIAARFIFAGCIIIILNYIRL